MKEYETVFIIDPGCDEAQVEQEINAVNEIIAAGQGKIVESKLWGRRRLAFEINRKKEGIYAFVRFNGTAEVLQELDRRFKLNELILRHLIVASQQVEGEDVDSGLTEPGEGESPESEDSADS